MKASVLGACLVVGAAIWIVQQNSAQDKGKDKPAEAAQAKAKETSAASTPAATPVSETAGKKNPVKATPESLAEAKKIYGYDCAMCHGEAGDGKGDLVDSMHLTMKNWQETAAAEQLDDQAMYDLIVKGKDKMPGEGDRLAPAKVWGLVHYVRTFGRKKTS